MNLKDWNSEDFSILMKDCEKNRKDGYYEANIIPYTPIKLIDKIFDKIPSIKEKIFDVKIGVIYCIEMAMNLSHRGFTNITMIVNTHDEKLNIQCSKLNIEYRVICINEEENMPKFDIVVGNPPYKGKKQLHQKFFNNAINITKDCGIIAFIQPATPYLNKKNGEGKFKHHEQMKEYIKQYKTSVWLFNPNKYFSDADIGNVLSVTTLKKIESNEKVSNIIYDFNGKKKIFNDIALEDITIHGDKPKIINSIRQKVKNYIELYNSLNDIIENKNKNKNKPFMCRLGKIRGDISGRNSKSNCIEPFFKNSFFTLVSKNKSLHVFSTSTRKPDDNDFAIFCNTLEEAENVYDYCTTKFTQFTLSLLKFTTNNHMGELKSVPVVNFNRRWTDKELFKLFKLTTEEQEFINNFIGDFYDK